MTSRYLLIPLSDSIPVPVLGPHGALEALDGHKLSSPVFLAEAVQLRPTRPKSTWEPGGVQRMDGSARSLINKESRSSVDPRWEQKHHPPPWAGASCFVFLPTHGSFGGKEMKGGNQVPGVAGW